MPHWNVIVLESSLINNCSSYKHGLIFFLSYLPGKRMEISTCVYLLFSKHIVRWSFKDFLIWCHSINYIFVDAKYTKYSLENRESFEEYCSENLWGHLIMYIITLKRLSYCLHLKWNNKLTKKTPALSISVCLQQEINDS